MKATTAQNLNTLQANKENTEVGQLCVKVRREKTTYFLLCKPLEPIDSVKRKLLVFHKGLEPGDIRFYLNTRVLHVVHS